MKKYFRKHTTLLLQLAAALLFATCHKQNETILDFTFTDRNTNKPVEGLEIYLQEFDQNANSGLITNKVTLASYKTDAYGKLYQVLKHLNTKKEHGIEWQKPSECYETGSYLIQIGQTNKYDRTLNSRGFYLVHFKNINPFNSQDKICYSFNKSATACPIAYLNSAFDFSVLEPFYKPKNYFYVKTFIIKNNVTTERLDSVFINSCDTSILNIFY
jgi:hypothetical protein